MRPILVLCLLLALSAPARADSYFDVSIGPSFALRFGGGQPPSFAIGGEASFIHVDMKWSDSHTASYPTEWTWRGAAAGANYTFGEKAARVYLHGTVGSKFGAISAGPVLRFRDGKKAWGGELEAWAEAYGKVAYEEDGKFFGEVGVMPKIPLTPLMWLKL